MRLFIAVNTPKPIKEYVLSLQALFADVGSFSFTQDCHLTLKFLGEVSPAKAENVKKALVAVKAAPFALTLDRFGVFPSESYVRVLWVGVSPLEQIKELAEKVNAALLPLFPKEKRFHPHFTIARIKNIKDKEKFLKIIDTKIEKKRFVVEGFELIQSVLQGGKPPVYTTIERFALQK